MRGTVSPKLTTFIEQANIASAEAKKNNISFSPKLVRENIEKLAAFMGTGPNIAKVEDRQFEVKGRTIPVRLYDPCPDIKKPVLLHYHGGGHMCGNVNLYDPVSRQLAKVTNCLVICVEYRLAPEFPYPLGIDDCEYALVHYKDVLRGFLFDDSVFIAGDSGGGAICTTLTMNSLNNHNIKIDKQILIYPSVDYTMSFPSIEENGHGFLLEQEKISWYFQQYFQQHANDNELVQNASPVFGPFSSTMPETLVITAGCDPLKDEGLAYHEALKANGVATQYHCFDGMVHAYMLLQSLVEDECQKTYQLIGNFATKAE
jgi:acetyl esterase/lipase